MFYVKTNEKKINFNNKEELLSFLFDFFSKHCDLEKCNNLLSYGHECNQESYCQYNFGKSLDIMRNIINYNINGAYTFNGEIIPMERFKGIFKTKLNECELKYSLVKVIQKILNKEIISENELQTVIQIARLADFLPKIIITYK